MIPIECPKCGRGGNIPPDRLDARLVCKACHAVFHMDSGGRMVLGEPGDPNSKKNKQAAYSTSDPIADLGETLRNIPKPVKLAVPAFLVLFVAWQFWPIDASLPYKDTANTIVKALVDNNKSKAVGYAANGTGEAVGKWFDLMRTQVDKNQIPADTFINPSLWSGVPEKDPELTLMVPLAGGSAGAPTSLLLTILLKKDSAGWMLDGDRMLADAEKSAQAATSTARK